MALSDFYDGGLWRFAEKKPTSNIFQNNLVGIKATR